MKTIITSKLAYERYNDLHNDCILQLKEIAENGRIELEENGFEDMAGNDICAFDNENVYVVGCTEDYPLHELDLLDAIKIINDFS